MPDVAVGAFVSTEEVLPDERVVDMDPKMRLLDPDQTQFTTMSSRVPVRATTTGEVQLAGGDVRQQRLHGGRELPFGSDDRLGRHRRVRCHQGQRHPAQHDDGEALLVTAVGANGDLTVVTSVGDKASAAGTSGDKLRVHRLGL